jgi:hypothetical protein
MAKSSRASGRFLLRTGPELHQALRDGARAARVSLNDYCLARLAGSDVTATGPAAAAVVDWGRRAFAEWLVGIAVYGSWARGEATGESDVDVLIVLDRSQPLRRDIYRRCDTADLIWDAHPVQIQVVQLPQTGEIGGGLWPEIALDGIVLVDRDFQLSRYLVAVRRAIVEGRLVRRTAHGQPYWTTAEAA